MHLKIPYILKIKKVEDSGVYITSLFLSLVVLFLYNPIINNSVQSFNRIIGDGLIDNIDIQRRISHFYFLYLIIVPAVYFIFVSIVNRSFINVSVENKNEFHEFLHTVSILSLLPVLILYINRYTTGRLSLLEFSITLPLIIVVSLIAFGLLDNYLKIKFSIFKWSLFSSFALLFPMIILLNKVGNPDFVTARIVISIIYGISIWSIFLILVVLVKKQIINELDLSRIQRSFTPLMYSLLAISFFLEFINILNQYEVFIVSKAISSLLIWIFLGSISILLYFFPDSKIKSPFNWEKYYYPAIILGFGFIEQQAPLQWIINTDLFESANHGLAITEFLNYGKIPILETFDAHMMSHTFWGILYGILNHDYFGAMFVPYASYILPIIYILSYIILSKFLGYDFAVLFTLLAPTPNWIVWGDIGFIAIICLIYAINKNNFFSYLIYWISLAVITIYRLDTGFAYAVATLGTLLITQLFFRNTRKLNYKYILNSLILFFSISLILLIIIGFVKDINVLNRIKEFLSLANSNVNWGYASLGDPGLFVFSFAYFFIPVIIMGLLFFLTGQFRKQRIANDYPQIIILFSLGLAYLVNFQRALVRHSLLEMGFQHVFYISIFFISLIFSFISKKQGKLIFTSLFFSLIIILNLMISNQSYYSENLLEKSITKYSSGNFFKNNPVEKVNRIKIHEKMKAQYNDILSTLNTAIKENETFLDFTNQTLLYGLAGKEKPVYINQSPGLLSGEFSQEQFINQIEEKKEKVIFALIPEGIFGFSYFIDRIPNPYRYYKVSEYISMNYMPLISIRNYSIWCRKESCPVLLERIKNHDELKNRKELKIVNDDYQNKLQMHTYNLGEIPFIWANYDKKQASKNEPFVGVITKKNSVFEIEMENIFKNKGNYLSLYLDSEKDDSCKIKFGSYVNNKFSQLNEFRFNTQKGKHLYLIRVSSDYYWYSNRINAFFMEGNSITQIAKLEILKGD